MHGPKRFTMATEIQVDFGDPQSPWQCGSNEYTEGPPQRYMPKYIDISGCSQLQLDATARQLDVMPRETLGFHTPAAYQRGLLSASCGTPLPNEKFSLGTGTSAMNTSSGDMPTSS